MKTKVQGRNTLVNELSVNARNGKVNDFSFSLEGTTLHCNFLWELDCILITLQTDLYPIHFLIKERWKKGGIISVPQKKDIP